ncbi:hypothetical protein FB567DRAFT_183908 [Paraphoma chrysanthemicola]|uniref:Uncharacterized protein n=1 Tax=Paraphoma chrysanthemicola TaxID=798071 RepID=A0A8K0VTD9_9PLEO|nr:hypothetical protein FB567DRAFT_183908 [Paraphoma chrysanthemicola]
MRGSTRGLVSVLIRLESTLADQKPTQRAFPLQTVVCISEPITFEWKHEQSCSNVHTWCVDEILRQNARRFHGSTKGRELKHGLGVIVEPRDQPCVWARHDKARLQISRFKRLTSAMKSSELPVAGKMPMHQALRRWGCGVTRLAARWTPRAERQGIRSWRRMN